MPTINDLRQQAATIKNATQVGENTATRVGTTFETIADLLEGANVGQGIPSVDLAQLNSLRTPADQTTTNPTVYNVTTLHNLSSTTIKVGTLFIFSDGGRAVVTQILLSNYQVDGGGNISSPNASQITMYYRMYNIVQDTWSAWTLYAGGGGGGTIDPYPVSGSDNAVASNGVFERLQQAAPEVDINDIDDLDDYVNMQTGEASTYTIKAYHNLSSTWLRVGVLMVFANQANNTLTQICISNCMVDGGGNLIPNYTTNAMNVFYRFKQFSGNPPEGMTIGVWTTWAKFGDSGYQPDNEDIDLNANDQLQFANKSYDASAFSGLGRVYLRKNIVTSGGVEKNVLTQAMMNTANTIYHIQYDYDLNGQTITLPAGCVLEFDGGSVKNGTISLNNCSIVAEGTIFGNDVTITGKCLQEASPDWFAGTDADKIEKAIAAFSCVKLSSRDYIITRTINVTKSFSLKGASIPDFFGDYSDARADMSASRLIASMNSGTMFLIRGTELTSPSAYGSFVVESVAFGLQAGISAGAVDGLTFTSYGGPSRPVVIRNCNFKALGKAISFDTSDYNSSTTGTNCGTITIENNNIVYCNYGIYGAGRYSVGLCVIRQNNIEQNTQCGIYFNHEQSFGVVGLSSLSIVDNQLEGQTEAVNILANGSFITISGNYFEKAGGQHIRVKQTSPAPLTICNNSVSNGALNIHCEGGILYARSNVRSTNYAVLYVYLYLKNVRIVENDIKIAECTGLILSARETATEKSFPIIARSNEALDAVRNGKFMKTIPVSSGLVQLPLSVTSYAAGTYTIAFLLNAPRTIDAEPYLVCINTSTYETTLPVKSIAISDEMYVVQFCVTLTSTSNIRVFVRNYSATTLIYVSDVVVVNGVADGIIKTIYDTINVNQPTLTAEDKGANYFDSPLNEALFFNGTAWASAYGRIASQPRVVSDSSPSVIATALDTTYIINGTLGNVTINLPAVTDGKPHKIVINGKTDASPVFSYSSSDGKGIAYEYGYTLAASTLYEITCRFNGAKWIVSLLKLQTSIILPAGYTELTYIEAQNGAYINTGYIPNANSEFEIDFMPLSYRGAQDFAFGSRAPYVALLLGSTTNKLYPIWGTSGASNTYEVTQLMNVRWKMKLNSTKFIYNGTEENIVSQSLGTTTYAFYLFTINDNGNASSSYMKARVYGFKISESGSVLHNFIPCIDPNNVVGMYDTIGGQFYGSANAQPFTAGE